MTKPVIPDEERSMNSNAGNHFFFPSNADNFSSAFAKSSGFSAAGEVAGFDGATGSDFGQGIQLLLVHNWSGRLNGNRRNRRRRRQCEFFQNLVRGWGNFSFRCHADIPPRARRIARRWFAARRVSPFPPLQENSFRDSALDYPRALRPEPISLRMISNTRSIVGRGSTGVVMRSVSGLASSSCNVPSA